MSLPRPTPTGTPVSRRRLFSGLAAGTGLAALAAAGAGVPALASGDTPSADTLAGLAAGSSELPPSSRAAGLGTILDYAADVPAAAAVADAGYQGVIRYVSQRRPGAEWMKGKPLQRSEADAMRAAGLTVVSCYQYGKAATADWLGGFPAGVDHARQALALHAAAGGPATAPIYASIDDNPTQTQLVTQVAPFLLGWISVLGPGRVGVYGNAPTISFASSLGLASWFWQHGWGTPAGYTHPRAHLRQERVQKTVDGITVDLNTVLNPQYGQCV